MSVVLSLDDRLDSILYQDVFLNLFPLLYSKNSLVLEMRLYSKRLYIRQIKKCDQGIYMKKTNAIRLLEQAKIDFELIEYQYDPENLDVAKIAADNELKLAKIYKTLIAKGDKTGPLVAVVPGDHSLSLKKLAGLSGNKKIALLRAKDLQKTTGYVRGGCSPIGLRKALPVYIDERAIQLDQLFVNAGTRGLLFGCAPKALQSLAKAELGDICQ